MSEMLNIENLKCQLHILTMTMNLDNSQKKLQCYNKSINFSLFRDKINKSKGESTTSTHYIYCV